MKRILLAILLLAMPALAQTQPHSATLSISAQPLTITGNNYFRSSTSGGPYTLLPACTNLAPTVFCVDTTVAATATYFYVATAICDSCQSPNESGKSIEVKAVIPADTKPPSPKPPVLNLPVVVSLNPPAVSETWALSTEPGVLRQFYLRGSTGGTLTRQKQFKPNVTSYVDTTVKVGKTYDMAIEAVTPQKTVTSDRLTVTVK